MTTTGDLGAAGNQNLARARARARAYTPVTHLNKNTHRDGAEALLSQSVRKWAPPRGRDESDARAGTCVCVSSPHVARVYTYARAEQRLRWPPRRRRWRRTEKGGRIRATQRNNQCSLRVIIPLLDRFDCFKGVTRRSSGRAAARYIYLTIFLIILYTFTRRAARRRADSERGSLSAEEITSFSNSRFLSGWVMPHGVQRVMAKTVIVHRPWRTRLRDRGWFIGNIYF